MLDSTGQHLESLSSRSFEEKVNYLIDYIAITDLVQRYGQGTDTRDFDLLRTCYGDEIEVDHSPTIGLGRMLVSADRWCELAKQFHTQLDGDEHVLIPQGISIDGNAAHCQVLMHAGHYYRDAKGSPYQTLIGRYAFDFLRTSEGWKITRSIQTVTWTEGNWQFHSDIQASLGNPNFK